MCTSGPTCWTPSRGGRTRAVQARIEAGVVGSAGGAGPGPRRGRGTSTSASSTSAFCSAEAEQTSRVGEARRAQLRDRLEGVDVAEVVADEHEGAGVLLLGQGLHGWPLCIPGDGSRSRCRPARPSRSWRAASSVSTGSSRSKAASGSASRRVCTATARPFTSTNASSRPPAGATRGSSRRKVASPVRRPGEITRRLIEDQRSLPYCPKRNSSRPLLAHRVADLVQAAEARTWRAGRPVTTATARTWRGQVDEELGGVFVDVGRPRGPRRSARGCRRSRARRRTRRRTRPARRSAARPRAR